MTVFISGGAKNGKSDFAQELAASLANPHYYVATMIPVDAEDEDRIAKHIASRSGLNFQTLECGRNILSCLDSADTEGSFLLDSVTALLTNELFRPENNYEPDPLAGQRCAEELRSFSQRVRHAVFVSDAIYTDAEHYDSVTELYRQSLAHIDRSLAEVCDVVIEFCAGQPIFHKGTLSL